MAEACNSLYKAELVSNRGPCRGLDDLEIATVEYIDWVQLPTPARWQPITPALTNCLVDHAAARGAILPTDPLLRYRDGHSLACRGPDHPWKRLGERLPWGAAQGNSTHWLRHTTLTWVERHRFKLRG